MVTYLLYRQRPELLRCLSLFFEAELFLLHVAVCIWKLQIAQSSVNQIFGLLCLLQFFFSPPTLKGINTFPNVLIWLSSPFFPYSYCVEEEMRGELAPKADTSRMGSEDG